MFSELPGLFDRDFVTGYLLPSIVPVLGTALIVSLVFGTHVVGLYLSPSQPSGSQFYLAIQDLQSATFLLGLAVMLCLTVAVLLLILNRSLIRFTEGYIPPVSWFRFIAVRRYRRLRRNIEKAEQRYIEEQEQGEVSIAVKRRYRELLLRRARSYPDQEEFVLATSFGNTIRAAEVYSRLMYGADIIPIWPRLLAIADADFKKSLSRARAKVDFSVNCLYTLFLLAIEITVCFSISTDPQFFWRNCWFILVILFPGIIAVYYLAVSSASEWGVLIRTASDLYLDSLFEKLRLRYPRNENERRSMWQSVSRSFLYLEPLSDLKTPKPGEISKRGLTRRSATRSLETTSSDVGDERERPLSN